MCHFKFSLLFLLFVFDWRYTLHNPRWPRTLTARGYGATRRHATVFQVHTSDFTEVCALWAPACLTRKRTVQRKIPNLQQTTAWHRKSIHEILLNMPSVLWHCSLDVRKSIRPVKIGVIHVRRWCGYLSGARCRLFALWSSWCHCTPKPHRLLPHLNPDWFYFSGTGLPRLSWEKRPLNGGCSNYWRLTAHAPRVVLAARHQ